MSHGIYRIQFRNVELDNPEPMMWRDVDEIDVPSWWPHIDRVSSTFARYAEADQCMRNEQGNATIPEGIEVRVYPRSIADIAALIEDRWRNIYFGARPHLDAMKHLVDRETQYICEEARGIVVYFLSNAETFKGPEAFMLKNELRCIVGLPLKKPSKKKM